MLKLRFQICQRNSCDVGSVVIEINHSSTHEVYQEIRTCLYTLAGERFDVANGRFTAALALSVLTLAAFLHFGRYNFFATETSKSSRILWSIPCAKTVICPFSISVYASQSFSFGPPRLTGRSSAMENASGNAGLRLLDACLDDVQYARYLLTSKRAHDLEIRRKVNWKDPQSGNSILHLMAYSDLDDAADLLLSHGAQPNIKNKVPLMTNSPKRFLILAPCL